MPSNTLGFLSRGKNIGGNTDGPLILFIHTPIKWNTMQIPLNDDTRRILGIVCIQCIYLAELLRSDGHAIQRKAEAEQAAVIHWMLNIYLEHGEKWGDVVEQEAKRMHLARKTQGENELAQSEKTET